MEKQIEELRSALKDADMDDEQREAAEATLSALETSLQEDKTAREAELAAKVVDQGNEDKTESSRSVEVDREVVEALQAIAEVSRVLTEGQTELLDELKAMRTEASEARKKVEEESTEEGDESKEEVSRTSTEMMTAIAGLRKLVEESIPRRRGKGPSVEEDRSESERLAEAVSKIKDPAERLRAVMKHSTGERSLV